MNARILVGCRGLVSESLDTCDFQVGELYPVDTVEHEFVTLRVPHLLSGQVAIIDRGNVTLEEPAPEPAPEEPAPEANLTPVAALAMLISAVSVCKLGGTRDLIAITDQALTDTLKQARAVVAAELARETATADQHERQRDALAELVRAAEMYATSARPRLGKLCKEAHAALAEWDPNRNTRQGQPWRVVVEVRGGAVQDVTAPKGAVVEVRDYDGGEAWESPHVCVWNGCEEAAR
jgi:hypothetical protein